MEKRRKKGISPVIATILLIAIVVILALIVFLWAKGFIKESVQKKGEHADYACNKIDLEVLYVNEEIQITNKGNIPVHKLEIKKKSVGKIDIQSENKRVGIGESQSFVVGNYTEIEVFPVVLGETETGKKIYTCKNSFIAK